MALGQSVETAPLFSNTPRTRLKCPDVAGQRSKEENGVVNMVHIKPMSVVFKGHGSW